MVQYLDSLTCIIWYVSQILTRDSVTVCVDAVIYARIFDATMSIINVENAHASTKLLAATTLRNVLGTKNLSEILSDRENIAIFMQVSWCNYLCSDLFCILVSNLSTFFTCL